MEKGTGWVGTWTLRRGIMSSVFGLGECVSIICLMKLSASIERDCSIHNSHTKIYYRNISNDNHQPSGSLREWERGLIMIILVIRLKPQKTHSFHKPSIILLKYKNMINILKTFLYLTRDLILLPHHHNSLLPPVPGVFGKPTVQDMAVGVYSSLSRFKLTPCMLCRYRSAHNEERELSTSNLRWRRTFRWVLLC